MLPPKYIPWLFDNRKAWEAAVADPQYKYDMRFDDFMLLYKHYRSGNTTIVKWNKVETPKKIEEKPKETGEILDQEDIDLLIQQMNGVKPVEAPQKVEEKHSGLMTQADLDDLFKNLL